MKRGVVIVLAFLMVGFVGCTGMRSLSPVSPKPDFNQQQEISKKRYLRVGIIAEKPSEDMVKMVERSFGEMERKYGIAVGAVTLIPISFDWIITGSQVWKKVFAEVTPKGPRYADVFVIFCPRLFLEDLFILVGAGPGFGGVELVFDRFVLVRFKSQLLSVHELEHVFGARDSWPPDRNLEVILKRKWRRFDGWYVQNHPELEAYRQPEEPVWSEGEHKKVVERAIARAKVKMEEFYQKYPYLRNWKTPWQIDPKWKEGDPLPKAYLDQVEKYYDLIDNPNLIGMSEIKARKKK